MKKYRYEIIIFVINGISMILELIASRILSPYFGNTNIVWTSIIGIILLSSSVGNYIGGKIADAKKENSLKSIMIATAIFILIIPFVQKGILSNIANKIEDVKIGAILGASILFLIPSLNMGIVTPIILKLKLNNMENAGKITGRLNAIATVGGLIGTFIGGFVLVPNIGSNNLLVVLVMIVTILIPLIDWKVKEKSNIFVAITLIIAIVTFNSFAHINDISQEGILQGTEGDRITYDTQYGTAVVYNEGDTRILQVNNGRESATFLSEDKINELVFEYTKYYDLMFKANIEIKDTLMIGGGGYGYPKYYISHYLDKNMDVVEIDGDITEIARRYFYLDKLIKDYELDNNKRLNIITEDGRVYLSGNTKKYDAILNDAFAGVVPAPTLTTIECIEKIKDTLKENGVYLTNVISSLEGDYSKFLRAEVNTLKQVFKNVHVIPCNFNDELYVVQNNMVIATDANLLYSGEYELEIAEDELILTDEFCPVESLIPW